MTQIKFSLVTAIIGVGYLRMMPLYVISEAISDGETQFLQDQSAGQEWRNPSYLNRNTITIYREVERDASTKFILAKAGAANDTATAMHLNHVSIFSVSDQLDYELEKEHRTW
jgi:hypothetical protein